MHLPTFHDREPLRSSATALRPRRRTLVVVSSWTTGLRAEDDDATDGEVCRPHRTLPTPTAMGGPPSIC